MRHNRSGGLGEADQRKRVLVDEEDFTRRYGRTCNPASVSLVNVVDHRANAGGFAAHAAFCLKLRVEGSLARFMYALYPKQCGWVELAQEIEVAMAKA